MYGMPKAREMSNYKLKLNLTKFGYKPAPITPGFWRHQTPPLKISLVVDELGVKYEPQADITHLLDAI